MDAPSPEFISTKEASKLFGYNPEYLASLCREGKIEAYVDGRSWRIRHSSLELFTNEQVARRLETIRTLSEQGKRTWKKGVPVAKRLLPKTLLGGIGQAVVLATLFLAIIGVVAAAPMVESRALARGASQNTAAVGLVGIPSVDIFFGAVGDVALELGHGFISTARSTLLAFLGLTVAHAPEVPGSTTTTGAISVIESHPVANYISNFVTNNPVSYVYSGSGASIEYVQAAIDNVRRDVARRESGSSSSSGGSTDISASSLEDLADVGAMTKVFGNLLYWDGSQWSNIATSSLGITGGSATPEGSDGQVQFNMGGAFGGDTGLAFSSTTNALTVGGVIQSTSGIFRGDDQYHQIILHNGVNASDYIEWGDTLASGGGHRFYVGGATPELRLQIATDGVYIKDALGVGSTSPSQSLSVQGNALISGAILAGNITATGTASTSALVISSLGSASTQCAQIGPDGTVSGTGSACGSGGGGAVDAVSNSDGTLTISPTTGAVVASLNLAHANTWTAKQTFSYASSTALSSVYASSTNAFFGALSVGTLSGIVKATAGVLSAATAGTDYESPLTFGYPLVRSVNALSLAFGTTTQNFWSSYNNFASLFATDASSTNATTTNLHITSATNGGLATDANGRVYSAATTTAGTGLTYSGNAFSVNTSQNIATLSNLTSNGLIKTSGGTGALSIATPGTDYIAGGAGAATTTYTVSGPFTTSATPIVFGASPITATYYGLATTSTLTASGVLYSTNGAAGVASIGTSTPTLSGAFSYSGTLGNFVNGVSGTLSLATNGVALTNLAQIAANTILGNSTGATGNVTAIATSSLFAAGSPGNVLTYTSAGTWVPSATTTFSTGLTYAGGSVTVNTSQNIDTLSNLTTNGLIKTSGGTGALSIATAGTDYIAGGAGAATTTVTCSGGTSCAGFVAFGAAPITISSTAGLTTYDAFTHPAAGQSATTSLMLFSGAASSTQLSATQAYFGGTATSTFTSAGFLGVGSSSPWALLSINPNGITGPAFAIGSTSATTFVVGNNGYVGIGTTSPTHQLEITASGVPNTSAGIVATYFGDNATSGNTRLTMNRARGTVAAPSAVAAGDRLYVMNGAGYDGTSFTTGAQILADVETGATVSTGVVPTFLGFATMNAAGSLAQRMRISSAGAVGIGTSTPYFALTIASSTASQLSLTDASLTSPAFNFRSINGNFYISTSSPSTFATSTQTRLTVASSGNIGIGAISPNATLEILAPGATALSGSANSSALRIGAGALGTTASNELALGSIGFTSGNSVALGIRAFRASAGSDWTTSAIGLGMDVDSTTRAGANIWLHANGNVGIGTTTPWRSLSVTSTSAQFVTGYDSTRYTQFSTDSAGDLTISPQGTDVFSLDSNLWICSGGACPSGTPAGTGNILAETAIGLGTSTPWAGLSVVSGKAVVVAENTLATSTSMTVDWRNGNQQLVRTGTSATTISFTGYIEGQKLVLTVCNPTATAGAISWGTQVLWAGGTAPTQTTTANKCDVWSFLATNATTTLKIFGAQSASF